jgi:penicillin-binding protein activator
VRYSRSAFSLLFLAIVPALVAGCGSETKVTRVDETVVTDISGRWNDTDSRLVAQTMVKEALASAWLENYTRDKARQPVVVVGTILNRTHDHINVHTFVNDLSRELSNSQKVTFVAGKGEREELREERREQAAHAREDTQKAPGKEIGADYMLKGHIADFQDEAEGLKAIVFQVDLEMIDLESNVKVWSAQKKIKKVAERKRRVF